MSEGPGKKAMLKELIKELHAGADPQELKQRFKDVLEAAGPTDIAQIEEELISEGMPREEIQRLCDLHLAILSESLERGQTLAPAGHPIHILMQEHAALLEMAGELRGIAGDADHAAAQVERIRQIDEHLRESESHYLREENVLFPYLEKHGITQPPAIMWMEHDQIRQVKKKLHQLIDAQDFGSEMGEAASSLADLLSGHFRKENSILFPTALNVIAEHEWPDIRSQFDEIGYCCFTPEPAAMPHQAGAARAPEPEVEGVVTFETGSLSPEQLGAILDTLPVDITFVDRDDVVRYFSKSADRIFERTKAVIGRKVQQCHPQKSIHVVNQLLDDLRSGRRDVGDFWIDFGGRFVYIRYFPVRGKDGDYLGCVEVTQDITDARSLKGEKRLLDG